MAIVQLSQFDRFKFQSGELPILVCGDHAYSVSYEEGKTIFSEMVSYSLEKAYHLCDYLVSPIINYLESQGKFSYLQNMVSRNYIDMNRSESRLDDNEEINDYLYRQIIRLILQKMKLDFQVKPFLLDLHSYPAKDESYGEFDLAILIQTVKGKKTNQALIEFTMNYWKQRKWKIGSSIYHNKDDVVEEIAEKQLATPILLELNEKLLGNEKQFLRLGDDLFDYLLEISKKVQKEAFNVQQDQIPESFITSPMNLANSTSILKHEKKGLQSISNSLIRKSYGEYLQLALDYSTLLKSRQNLAKSQDSSLGALIDNIEDKYGIGDKEKIIIADILQSLSERFHSIIIPIELLFLALKGIYIAINRFNYQEWYLQTDGLLSSMVESSPDQYDIAIPILKSNNPFHELNPIYKFFQCIQYPSNNTDSYLCIVLNFKAISSLSESDFNKDLGILNKLFHSQYTVQNFKKSKDASKIRDHWHKFQIK